MSKKYLFEYDDPYKLLASHIQGNYAPAEVLRFFTDDAFILNIIAKETRAQDMRGHFTDCIIEGILDDKNRMEYMRELDKLSLYYFKKLDRQRLRNELKMLLAESGIIIE